MKKIIIFLLVLLAVLGMYQRIYNINLSLQDQLVQAAAAGNIENMQALIVQGADVNQADTKQKKALLEAAARNKQDAVKFLLSQGANIDDVDNKGHTALFKAALGGHDIMLQILLDRGANIEHQDNMGRTALFIAALAARAGSVQTLLDRGAKVNHKDNLGKTVLVVAAAHPNPSATIVLLDRGLPVHQEEIVELSNTLDYLKRNDPLKVHAFQAHMGLNIAKIEKISLQADIAAAQQGLEELLEQSVEMSAEELEAIQSERNWIQDFKKEFTLYTENKPNKLADFIFNTSKYSAQRNYTAQVFDILRKPWDMCQPLLDDLADTPARKKMAQEFKKEIDQAALADYVREEEKRRAEIMQEEWSARSDMPLIIL